MENLLKIVIFALLLSLGHCTICDYDLDCQCDNDWYCRDTICVSQDYVDGMNLIYAGIVFIIVGVIINIANCCIRRRVIAMSEPPPLMMMPQMQPNYGPFQGNYQIPPQGVPQQFPQAYPQGNPTLPLVPQANPTLPQGPVIGAVVKQA
jgi:hypothetical protein